jgi:putative membrane protein
MGFLIRTAITAVALAAADYLLLGIEFVPTDLGLGAEGNKLGALLVSAVALGILNALVRPILLMLSLPVTCLTLGLFILVVNGIVLWLLQFIPFTGFVVHDLFAAIFGALVVMVVSFVLNLVIPGR